MNAHQVITGALNSGEHVYALGNIEGLTFTACAVGSDVVILDSDFNRVQIIPEVRGDVLVTSLSCCKETGKIAVTYGNLVRLLEATSSGVEKKQLKSSVFQFTWVETYCFKTKELISSVLWTMEGMRILFVLGNKLVLHQHRNLNFENGPASSFPVIFCIAEEDVLESYAWEVLWSTELSFVPKFVRYSPDGFYLAVSGDKDCFIRLFYQNRSELKEVEFSSLTLSHPAPVCGFEWRKTGRYMPRKCISSTLISWCEDNTSRVWKESPPPEASIIDLTGEGGGELLWEKQSTKKTFGKQVKVKKAKDKILKKLKSLIPEKMEEVEVIAIGLRAQIGRTPSFLELQHIQTHDCYEIQFHLAATINVETDCLLVPSFNASNNSKPFSVHWLNNKELVFTVGAEKLLAEAVLLDIDDTPVKNFHEDVPMEKRKERDRGGQLTVNTAKNENTTSNTGSDCPTPKDILDVKLEILLRQWTKSNDVLFAIHPVDGSLLTWTIEWLDDGFRQPLVSYSSRLPGALPSNDAKSLHSKLNTFNPHEPIYLDVLRSDLENKENNLTVDKIIERQVSNRIHILTSHDNGTLNLWHMSVDDRSSFSHVIIAHPVLPLILTTSKFNSSNMIVDPRLESLSEVIMWKISPVGPLCKEGGIRELARVASTSIAGFSSISWIPVILPNSTLGTVCNSPSSCFVSFDGHQLVIYQAVLDAKGLLAELANMKTALQDQKNSFGKLSDPSSLNTCLRAMMDLNIVSMQSTAKPGCILEIGKIEDTNLKDLNLLFLHVFQSKILAVNETGSENIVSSVADTGTTTTFNDNFFIVIVEKQDEEDILLMYSLAISSQSPKALPNFDEKLSLVRKGELPSSSSSAAKLNFGAELVCRQPLKLPTGTRIKNVSPAAGHLSSSSLYPACKTPYVLVSSDSDDSIRFWCCEKKKTGKNTFAWREWQMINENHPSELGIEGEVIKVTAAHSGRIACAYMKSIEGPDNPTNSVQISVFECESSGGVEWFREDSFHIHENRKTMDRLDSGDCETKGTTVSKSSHNYKVRDSIRLDWVSTEDGGHMLTVGVGTKIYIYAQVSQDPAQQNVALMRESESSLRRPSLRKSSSFLPSAQSQSRFTRWECCRVLALETADGLPPIPTSLSWARDGILIVGMQSEIRVYNQWNFAPYNNQEKVHSAAHASHPIVNLTISTSHSMLDQITKKKEALVTNRSRVFLDFVNNMHKTNSKENESLVILDILKSEGIFEAARMCSPILPQYHPKQLIVLLNAGKKRRVKAILNHVLNCLKQRTHGALNPLSRAASIKRMSAVTAEKIALSSGENVSSIDDENMEYDEIDDIPLIPLYALIAVDDDNSNDIEKPDSANAKQSGEEYHDLFDNGSKAEDDIDELLKDTDSTHSGRSRHLSAGSDVVLGNSFLPCSFTSRDYRKLADVLTHTHLPGLSSVDQMHLLAIADTLSHFSNNLQNKIEQANAALQPVFSSVLGDNTAGGYAAASAGVETVDECGLRYLMAMKQHEYLLVCLPIKQRMELKKNGLPASSIIWAQHSETETELLNAVPGLQKANPTWDELRGLGIAWWLKNTSSLRICIEKLAKAAFQQNQDPMDASLFYLALRKKNVLTHLFKTIRNTTMSDFFMNDFTTDHWKKVAAKNAFVLMSKQRFQHAAAFFLLSGSLKDAVQTILTKCNDLQLALVVVRLFENDCETQQRTINHILCREVIGISFEEFETQRGRTDDDTTLSRHASKEPFVRSMAFWMMKDYTRAAHTLVQEAQSDRHQSCLSDIFNFYSFLRKHPLVVRQRLSNAGGQVGTTEKFLALGKQLERLLTPPERRLFFRTSAEHMSRGCPMLSLDVLNMLPKHLSSVQDYDEALKILLNENNVVLKKSDQQETQVDWSLPVVNEDVADLNLEWSDDESVEDTIQDNPTPQENHSHNEENLPTHLSDLSKQLIGAPDIFAQHMKFVASLRILTEELSTLASGFEVDGGQLRDQLLIWLDREVEVLENSCDYHQEETNYQSFDSTPSTLAEETKSRKPTLLANNQKLLRSFTSFCTLHSGHNHKLASVLMELLLILLDLQTDGDRELLKKLENSDTATFPLFDAAVSTPKMFVSSPLMYIENQCSDLLTAINEMEVVPNIGKNLQKCYMLYNLSQGFSRCLYQSLFNNGTFHISATQRSLIDAGFHVVTPPVKWPGVEKLVALIGREKEDDVPHLRLLIVECFIAINMSLFCFALSAYDSRWLYRLSAHEIDPKKFGSIFGGGGEVKTTTKPLRPPRPSMNSPKEETNVEGDHLRSRLNLRILGCETSGYSSNVRLTEEKKVNPSFWVPPQKNVVQLFAEKPFVLNEENDINYESDVEQKDDDFLKEDEHDERGITCENATPSSFSWQLLRLVLINQQIYRIEQFLVMTGFDPIDVANVAPRVDTVMRQLKSWIVQQTQLLKNFPGGIPNDILPDMTIDMSDQHLATSIKKYAVIVKKNNTPFESEDKKVQAIQRLWSFLVREDHLQEIFIKFIFLQSNMMDTTYNRDSVQTGLEAWENLPDAFRIMQKDNEPIVAFACNQENNGLIVVSNGRELQEMDISEIFKNQHDRTSWMWNRAELDMYNMNCKRDAIRDNDDYQIFTELTKIENSKNTNMILKRQVPGIRRIDSHPNAPYYVTGSSDGAIRVWKWGSKDAVHTARVAGQHAKVTKIAFSCNGNKFAAVDGDGMLCLWQASHGSDQKKPFFSQRCHNKTANDVRFLGHSSSVLLTAGLSSLDYNLGLWDTLLPINRALVHSWVAHPEGAMCAIYSPSQQTIYSGGRHGDICLWDVRQRQLRHTIRAFDQTHIVKTLVSDSSQDLIVAGSSEGDIKIWSADSVPQLMYNLTGEHSGKGGFSFRQVGQSVQGVQQLFVDQNMRLFSCGADSSLKFRTLPSVFNMTNLL